MPRAKTPMTDGARSQRFAEEVRRRKTAADFDQGAAEDELDAMIRHSIKNYGA